MRLRARVVLVLALACAPPLVFLAATASRATSTWMTATTVEFQYRTAEQLASVSARQLNDLERVLKLQFANFRLGESKPEVRRAFLIATYRLFPELGVAVLQSAEGEELAPPVYLRRGEPEWVPGHEALTPDRVHRLRQELPPVTRAGEVAWGHPYLPPDGAGPVIPASFASPWGDGVVLGVELGFGQIPARIALAAGEEGEAALLSTDGTTLYRAGPGSGLVLPDRFRELLTSAGADVRYLDEQHRGVFASLARVPGHELVVVVAEPAAAVESAGKEIRQKTWYIGGVSLVVAGVLGWFLANSIIGPVRRLREAARAVGEGDTSQRVPEQGSDELAALGRTFNLMAGSIERSRAEIAAKNEEIEAFNRELVQRVEARTAELRDAQARLVQSGQLAAVAEMSAGLAHELNNPLAGLLGMIQLARARADERQTPLLDAAEREALRCRDIVAQLLRFTREPASADEPGVVDLDVVIADVLALMRGPLEARQLQVEHRRAPAWVAGDAAQLGRAVGQLLTSIRAVAAPGARLQVQVDRQGPEHRMSFALSAVVSSQDDWRAASFGFWVARQVLAEHGATLEEPVTGGTWRLRAPVAPAPVGG